MKKIIITFFAIALTFGAFAQQRDTMFVHKGQTIFHSATAEIDSIVFVRTGASVPLGSTVTIRDTVEIMVRDTVEITVRDTIEVIVRDTVEITIRDTIEITIRDTVFYCPVAVSGITLYPTTANLHFGGTLRLVATILPENATNRTIIWTSSNPIVAIVSEIGIVTALDIGEATITATTQDGNYIATSTISVVPLRGCNTNPLTFTLGVPYFATDETWIIPGTDGRPTQEWSDAVRAPGCDKTTFAGGTSPNINADCRNATNGFDGHYFTWCMIMRFANQLCPDGLRVPTQQDFMDLDLNLGGNGQGRNFMMVDGGAVNGFTFEEQFVWYVGAVGTGTSAVNRGGIWGGTRFTGHTHTNVASVNTSAYWSSTESNEELAFTLFINAESDGEPAQFGPGYWPFFKHVGKALRCVRNVE